MCNVCAQRGEMVGTSSRSFSLGATEVTDGRRSVLTKRLQIVSSDFTFLSDILSQLLAFRFTRDA